MPRHSAAEARQTRQAIVRLAADVASAEGLAGITIGNLADRLAMSKAGVIGQFGSKEALQLAAVDNAVERFTAAIWTPVADRPPGAERLAALLTRWLDYLVDPPFPGGCFLSAAAFEIDDRPGPVRDQLSQATLRWHLLLEREIRLAIEDGNLPAELDPVAARFQLVGATLALVQSLRLKGEADAVRLCRAAMAAALGSPDFFAPPAR